VNDFTSANDLTSVNGLKSARRSYWPPCPP
jgi:hypothetical protein